MRYDTARALVGGSATSDGVDVQVTTAEIAT
jgi:hypothetical protein